jgi:hypothetical protein
MKLISLFIFATIFQVVLNQAPLPGLDKVGLGLNIISGELTYRPLVEFHYDNGQTWLDPYDHTATPRMYNVPDEVSVIPTPSSSLKAGSFVFTNTQDFVSFISQNFAKGSQKGFGFLGRFSQSTTVQQMIKTYAGSSAYYSIVEQSHSLFQLSMWPVVTCDPRVQEYIDRLPSQFDLLSYLHFINFFGTHYIYTAQYGGKLHMDTTIYKASDSSSYSKTYNDKNSQSSFLGFSGSSTSVVISESKTDKDFQDMTFSYVTLLGGNYENYKVEEWPQWLQTLRFNPIQISFDYRDISDLFLDPVKKLNMKYALNYYLMDKGKAIYGSKGFPAESCRSILKLTKAVNDGTYYLDPSGQMSFNSLQVTCDMKNGGWTVIDPSIEPKWRNYFNSWREVSTIGTDRVAIPNDNPTYQSFRTWFKLDKPSQQYTISFDCTTCPYNYTDSVYYATGNFFGCNYYNRKCDMSGHECHNCYDGFNLNQSPGTCAHQVKEPDFAWRADCAASGWNVAPTVGLTGRFCVCYRFIEV